MRLVFTMLFAFLFCSIAVAQINSESPYPVDFVISSPASIAGVYDYGTQTVATDDPIANPIWGPTLSETLEGEIVWAYTAAGDSLGCEAIVTDLTGKLAFIRRGDCDFATKVHNAQLAGAIGVVITNHYTGVSPTDGTPDTDVTIYGMTAVEAIGAPVTIPAVFVNRTTGELITGELDSGEPVMVSFTVNSFFEPVSSFSYHTPLSQAQEVNVFRIKYINPSPTETVNINVSATVTAPSGAQEVLSGSSDVAPLTTDTILLDGSYLPTEMGEHTVLWEHDQSDETNESKFIMTDYTFAVNQENPTISIGPSDADFSSTFNFVYQVGALVLPNADGATTSYASFGITNAAAIHTGDAISDAITVILYDADFDDDGTLDFAASGGSFNDLVPVALGEYIIVGTEAADELLYVELEDLDDQDNLVLLKPNGAYYIVIAYDGVEAGSGIAPRFLGSAGTEYVNFPTTPLFLDELYTGWENSTVAVQLHLSSIVGTDDIVSLDASKVSVAPNPVQDELNLNFALNEVADKINVGISDVSGQVLANYEFEHIFKNNVQIDVEDLPAGVYFIGINTPEGYRSMKIVKI